MEIVVQLPEGGKRIKLEVEAGDTIEHVKTVIQDVLGGCFDEVGCVDPISLSCAGELLENGSTLSDYNIQNGNLLEMNLMLLDGPPTCYIKTVTGKTIQLDVEEWDFRKGHRLVITAKIGDNVEEEEAEQEQEESVRASVLRLNCDLLRCD